MHITIFYILSFRFIIFQIRLCNLWYKIMKLLNFEQVWNCFNCQTQARFTLSWVWHFAYRYSCIFIYSYTFIIYSLILIIIIKARFTLSWVWHFAYSKSVRTSSLTQYLKRLVGIEPHPHIRQIFLVSDLEKDQSSFYSIVLDHRCHRDHSQFADPWHSSEVRTFRWVFVDPTSFILHILWLCNGKGTAPPTVNWIILKILK